MSRYGGVPGMPSPSPGQNRGGAMWHQQFMMAHVPNPASARQASSSFDWQWRARSEAGENGGTDQAPWVAWIGGALVLVAGSVSPASLITPPSPRDEGVRFDQIRTSGRAKES
jgi:hypothetical protein